MSTPLRTKYQATLLAAGLAALLCLLPGCTQASKQDREALAQGFTNYSSQQYDRAEAAADAYIRKYPDDPNVDEAYYLRGMARLGKGSPAAAAQDLNTAIAKTQRDDLNAKAHRALGDMAYAAQRFEQSIEYYCTALQFYPSNRPEPMVLYRLGAAYQNLGRWAEARPQLERVSQVTSEPRLRQLALNRSRATAFSLQFGAFGQKNNAEILARQLNAVGIKAVLVPEIEEAALVYSVRAGVYADIAHADEARRKLLTKYPLVRIVP